MSRIKFIFCICVITSLGLLTACAGVSPTLTPTSTTLPATPTPQATETTDADALRFIAIPEQVTPQGESFFALDAFDFLRYRRFTAEEMTWTAVGSEHITAAVLNGVVTVNPIDNTWTGSEAVRIEACEPSGACVNQEILYSILDKTAFSDVRVTFVGNSGFLISVGDKKVLIDAFFTDYPPEYVQPENVKSAVQNAEAPFDDVDLILATHDHGDHFMASMVRQHMQNNPNAIFVSTTQAASQLADLGERVIGMDPTAGAPVQVEANGILVEAVFLGHGYPPNDPNEVFNNGYIVTINEIKVFHTGDLSDLQDVLQYNLLEKNIDIAFIQHFYLRDGRARSILVDGIGADYLFPIHYVYTDPVFDAAVIRANYPEAIIFSRELESWFMPKANE